MENVCKLCNNGNAKYSCPRCSVIYCSLTCYQSQQHLECSELFYKDCIAEELSLKDGAEVDIEAKRKMLQILERNQNEEDSDDDSIVSISERLAGVDLDDTDKVWEKLTQDEKQEFMAFLKSDDVGKLVIPWIPWWERTLPKITELCSESNEQDSFYPKLVKIQQFSTLTSKSPSECVKHNLANILGAYAFTTRYFNGDHMEFAEESTTCVITLSLTLKSNQIFTDFDTAFMSIKQESLNCDWIVTDEENFINLQQDLNNILKKNTLSNDEEYNIKFILYALSDLSQLLQLSLKNDETKFQKSLFNQQFPNVKLQSKSLVKNCLKKIDYFLSFTICCL